MDAARLLLVFLMIDFSKHSRSDTIISTTHGDVKGLDKLVSGRLVNVYWGIPYATIPARFQRPERAQPWQGVYDAVTPPPSCPEVPYPFEPPLIPATTTPFDEDCLFLNIWVPQGCQAKNANGQALAVMVWIHGGVFEWGSTTVPTYDGQVLAASQCVIVASMNYRLGPLGFLSLGSDRAPGNVGILDQNMALRWIHENINNFGGNPELITLFGESFGAVSVGVHMTSPLSRDLFSRAIMQSGTATEKWVRRTLSKNIHNAQELARLVDCPSGDDHDSMITCLSGVDSVTLGRAVLRIPGFQPPGFGLIVDGYVLPEQLGEPYFRGDVKNFDVMLGANKNEASTFLSTIAPGPHTAKDGRPQMDRSTFQQLLTGFVLQVMADPPENVSLVSELVEYIYMSSSLPSERDDHHTALEKVLQDLCLVCPMYPTAIPFVDHSDVFMYSFEHRTSVTTFPEWMGVVHASELDLVFGRPVDKEGLFTDQERHLSNVMMTAWANFAKFGNPNGGADNLPVKWPALDKSTYPYAVFDTPNLVTIKHGLRHRECAFWNGLYISLLSKTSNTPIVTGHDEL